jgi:hypothetical protein
MPPSGLDEEVLCPPLEYFMPNTFEILESGAVENLAHVLETEMDQGTRKIAIGLVIGILDVFPPSRLEELEPLIGTELMNDGLTLVTSLLGDLNQMPEEVQDPMIENLYTTVYVCPLDRALSLLNRTLSLPPEGRAQFAQILAAFDKLVNTGGVTTEKWFNVLKPLLGVLVNGAQNPEALVSLLENMLGEDGPSKALLDLVKDPVFMGDVEAYLGCMLEQDEAQGDGLLYGLSYLLAEDSIKLGDLGPLLAAEDPTGESIPLMQTLLEGLIADADTVDGLRTLLAWMLEPTRAKKLMPELSIFIEQGALEELLTLATLIGRGNCEETLEVSP